VHVWRRTQERWWCSLEGQQFEKEVGKLLKERGYNVQFTGASGEGGVDLVLDSASETILVQCKAHKSPVGPAAVRDLYGALTHRGGSEAWLVSTSPFTGGATEFARDKPLRLIEIRELLDYS